MIIQFKNLIKNLYFMKFYLMETVKNFINIMKNKNYNLKYEKKIWIIE